jgi:hypothetical protein
LDLPHQERAFRLPLARIVCALAFYFCNLLSYWTGWETVYKLAIAIGVGFVVFAISILRGKLKNTNRGMKSAIWIVPYLSGLTLISYLGAFGGQNIIPFGWDFLVIAIFSMVMLYLAVISRSTNMARQFAKHELMESVALESTF